MTNSSHPTWDLSSEYTSINDPVFLNDFERASGLVGQIAKLPMNSITPEIAKDAMVLSEQVTILLYNLISFINFNLSIDSNNSEQKAWKGKLEIEASKFGQVMKPVSLWIASTDDANIEKYLLFPETKTSTYKVKHQRKFKDHLLSVDQEQLLSAMSVSGHAAWSNLYETLSSTIRVKAQFPDGEKTIGLSEAWSMQFDGNADIRKAAYHAVHTAWKEHQESAAAILNAIAQWRLAEYQKRSHKTKLHFLTPAYNSSHLTEKTVSAMMSAIKEYKTIAQRGLKAQAKYLGKTKLDPWDLLAPFPAKAVRPIPYSDAIKLVEDAYQKVDPNMGEFVRLMQEKNWIEGRVLPTKRPGAYCGSFLKSRTPRVYQSYGESAPHVGTLAHELGHAFHSWVMRDLSLNEVSYPMTLAETASVFGEAALADHWEQVAAQSGDQEALLEAAWGEVESAGAFLLNIPTRFEFEKRFYEMSQNSRVSADQLKSLMKQCWEEMYGDTLSEVDQYFWASKQHFHFTGVSFYNYPYSFGYLFSLGVYAQKEKLGKEFYSRYVALLRDTGRMSCEEVAKKHLGVDLEKPDFWRDSLNIVKKKIERFEQLVG